jgi:type I protein arginine methyltransferase
VSYSINMFGRMFQDKQRHEGYMEALRRSIKPGDTVIDIGTGMGFYALAAAKMGASQVYAIETNPLVRIGPELARRNGVEHIVEFYEMMSIDFTPPEPVDVVFADLRGLTTLLGFGIESLFDARQRLLKPGGVLIPGQDILWCAPVTAAEHARASDDMWANNPFSFDLSPVAELQRNDLQSTTIGPDQLVAVPQRLATINFGVDAKAQVESSWDVIANRTAVVDALGVWFTSTLCSGVHIGNDPDRGTTVYGNAYFRLQHPIEVSAGEVLSCTVRANRVGGDYAWTWSVRTTDREGATVASKSSTMLRSTFTPNVIRALSPQARPSLTQPLEIDRLILNAVDGHASLFEIASKLMERFPDVFPDTTALDRVRSVLARYHSVGQV